MSKTIDYAPRGAWSAAMRDLGFGLWSAVRTIVTAAGCLALVAAAVVATDRELRVNVADAVVSALPKISAAASTFEAAAADMTPAIVTVAAVVKADPREPHVSQYLARRYRVADEAARVLVSAAFETGRDKKLDPLLILSVMAIESSLNPFAQSPVGAQGLMQVMTRVHAQRFEPHGGETAALDPIVNIKVGSSILHELIARGGSIERGLQLYVGAGNLPDDGGYGARVLGERARLELAASGKVGAAITAAIRAGAQAADKPANEAPTPAPAGIGGIVTEAEQAPASASGRSG